MKLLKGIALVALIAMTTAVVNAQKLGYVNSQVILAELPEVKQAEANLEAHKSAMQKKGQQMVQSLQKKYGELQQQEKNGELSRLQLEDAAKLLKEEEQKIGQFEQQMQQEIMQKQEKLLKPILDKVKAAIDAVAKEQGYTYIFDAIGGFILYADEKNDVSALVKAKL